MLTTAQLQTLRTAITNETDPAFVVLRTSRSTTEIGQWLNQPSTLIAWRTAVSQDEIMQNGFDWVRVDNLSVGAARIWEWLFDNQPNTINPSKANVRAGIDAVWKGTAADLAVRAAVYSHCKRPATRGEKVFATGAGTTNDPASLGYEGELSEYDIRRACWSDDGEWLV